MKKTFIAFSIIYSFTTSCNEKCVEHLYQGTVVVDVSDTTIIKQFYKEATLVAEKLAPTSLNRCEGVKIDIEAIGASIENNGSSVLFPANGVLNSNIGNYDLSDSNNAKLPTLNKGMQNALNGFKAIDDNESQIFYTLTQILNNKKSKIIIYTDLLEHYGTVSFYKNSFDFGKTYTALLKQYSMDTVKVKFNGTLTIVTPMEKNQEKVLNARKFFKYYFDKIGISHSQFEFVGTITQSKF